MKRFNEIKRVIDGCALNTETSLLIHEHFPHPLVNEILFPKPFCIQLFRTRTGQFFIAARKPMMLIEPIGLKTGEDTIAPIDTADAHQWMKAHCPDKLAGFVDPEATDVAGTTLLLRMDETQKRAIARRAKMNNLSANAYIIRSIQHAMATEKPLLAPPPESYVNSTGRRVLTNEGFPGMDGLRGAGTSDELALAHFASFIHNYPHRWSETTLDALILLLTYLKGKLQATSNNEEASRTGDLIAWFKLHKRGVADWVGDALFVVPNGLFTQSN